MAKRPIPIPTPSMIQAYETTLEEYRTLLEGYKQLLDERSREDLADDQDRYAWDPDEYTLGVTEALEQLLALFTDVIHVEDLVTLRDVDRRHILLVLAQAREALGDGGQPDFLRGEPGAVPESA
jgi:hypothetical protein